jgi:CBS domain-containing protein
MQAEDLVEQVPLVRRETGALEAARIVAALRVGGIVVADDSGEPVAVIAGLDLLRLVVPPYVRENVALAHVYDEAGADEVCAGLREHTVGDLLDDDGSRPAKLPQVAPEDTLVEIATVMLRERVSVVVVRPARGAPSGVVTLARVLAAVLAAAGEAGPGVRETLARDLAELHENASADRQEPEGTAE